jgi:hypothetical protein
MSWHARYSDEPQRRQMLRMCCWLTSRSRANNISTRPTTETGSIRPASGNRRIRARRQADGLRSHAAGSFPLSLDGAQGRIQAARRAGLASRDTGRHLRHRPHEETVIEFSGDTMNDLAIAVIAGFNWLNHCAGLAGADRRQFSGTLNHFRKVVISAQRWWEMDGAKARYAQMLQAAQEPPLFLNLVWADCSRLADEIAAVRG